LQIVLKEKEEKEEKETKTCGVFLDSACGCCKKHTSSGQIRRLMHLFLHFCNNLSKAVGGDEVQCNEAQWTT